MTSRIQNLLWQTDQTDYVNRRKDDFAWLLVYRQVSVWCMLGLLVFLLLYIGTNDILHLQKGNIPYKS